jgi:hypothetical protein
MPLSMNDGGRLGHPALSGPRKDDISSAPDLVGHGSVAYACACIEPTDTEGFGSSSGVSS